MILPEDMRHVAPRFTAASLTVRFVASQDPETEDDRIEIFANGEDTRVTIQVALIGGGFYVNEYHGADATLVLTPRGNFRTLRKAIDRAIEVVRAKQAAEAAS